MASVFGFNKQDTGKLAIVRALRSNSVVGVSQSPLLTNLTPTLEKFTQFWELMDAVKKHGYVRASMSVVGRSAVGAWWTLRRHPEYGKNAPERHRKRLFAFYMFKDKQWDNIKDYQNIAFKLMIGTMYLRYFGQAAYYIVRDEDGNPLGLDFIHGLVVPNVDYSGKFKSPAFVQFPTSDPTVKVEFPSAKDVVFIANPDWEGSPMGGSDIEALTTYQLPLDIYLQTAAREYMKNRDKPELVYQLAPDISDEAFDEFVKWLEAKHSGAGNLGRSQVAVQGEFEVHELRPYPDALPYQESRQDVRDEMLAVAGVSGAKLGLSESLASANLREMRREFHETSLVPLFTLMEIAFYEQIHVREFNASGWEFKFNAPDFLNAVERATVHMRYRQMGVLSPNEVRADLNLPPREGGDEYEGESQGEIPNPQGSPPEGRESEPDAPSQTGEPRMDDDPVRGDQHDETPRDRMLRELRLWREFALKRMKRGKSLRDFRSDYIPPEVNELISSHLQQAKTVDEVVLIFSDVLAEAEESL